MNNNTVPTGTPISTTPNVDDQNLQYTNPQPIQSNTSSTQASEQMLNATPTYINPVEQSQSTSVDPMVAVANLNKEEAMEDALSHTNQYSPFEMPKQVVNQETKKSTNNKSAYIFIGVIFLIMLLFILLLPHISKLFGW